MKFNPCQKDGRHTCHDQQADQRIPHNQYLKRTAKSISNKLACTQLYRDFFKCNTLHRTRSTEMEIDENASQKCRWFRVSLKFGAIGLNLRFNPVVTFVSAAVIWFFVIWCSVKSEVAYNEMTGWMAWITETCTWMYIGTQDAWAVFIIVLYFSKYGTMKLGKPDDKPDFSDATYFTMLFAAGIGVGLFYFGVGMYRLWIQSLCLTCLKLLVGTLVASKSNSYISVNRTYHSLR